jgi:hypothetical protein
MRSRHFGRDAIGIVLGGAALIFAAAPMVAAAQPQRSLATASGAKFTFSGALTGTLTLTASGCQGATGGDAQFELYGKLSGMAKVPDNYTVTIVDPGSTKGGGTWTSFPVGKNISVILQAQISNAGYSWIASSGKLTTKQSTGSLNAKFIPVAHPASGKSGKGNVHISGAWSCDPA